jgi:hypothetical protein
LVTTQKIEKSREKKNERKNYFFLPDSQQNNIRRVFRSLTRPLLCTIDALARALRGAVGGCDAPTKTEREREKKDDDEKKKKKKKFFWFWSCRRWSGRDCDDTKQYMYNKKKKEEEET